MDGIATRLDAAAGALHEIERALIRMQPGTTGFAVDADGLPGRVGHALHSRWADMLTATGRHAGDLAHRSAELAASVRAGRDGYTEADELVRRRLEQGT